MISEILPLTKNKLEIFKYIYEKKGSHLLDISKNLKIHPYSVQKTLKSIKKLFVEKKAGRTIILSLDKNLPGYFELLYLIEDYKLTIDSKDLKILIRNLKEFFSKDKNVLSCVLFGSFARNVSGEDIDLLFLVKKRSDYVIEKCSQLSTLFGKEVSPLVMLEKEFKSALQSKEPTIISILEPSQRLLVVGKEYFLRFSYDG
ncbi:MAG: nucleotidyltransferase domain-containing protein [Nanoarchaeota archaeon]